VARDRACAICGLWRVEEVDEALERGVSPRAVERRLGIGHYRLRRHLLHLAEPERPRYTVAMMMTALEELEPTADELRDLTVFLAQRFLGYDAAARAKLLIVARRTEALQDSSTNHSGEST
jgi:hypothetical protein